MPPPRAPMLLHLEIIASDNGTSLPPREAICNSIFTFQQAPHSCSGFGGGGAPIGSCRDAQQSTLYILTLLCGQRRLEHLWLLVVLTFFFHK